MNDQIVVAALVRLWMALSLDLVERLIAVWVWLHTLPASRQHRIERREERAAGRKLEIADRTTREKRDRDAVAVILICETVRGLYDDIAWGAEAFVHRIWPPLPDPNSAGSQFDHWFTCPCQRRQTGELRDVVLVDRSALARVQLDLTISVTYRCPLCLFRSDIVADRIVELFEITPTADDVNVTFMRNDEQLTAWSIAKEVRRSMR